MPDPKPTRGRRPAVYRRAYRGETTLLCSWCAVSWRGADGMTGLPKRGRG